MRVLGVRVWTGVLGHGSTEEDIEDFVDVCRPQFSGGTYETVKMKDLKSGQIWGFFPVERRGVGL